MYVEKYLNTVPQSSGWATDSAFAASVGCLAGKWSAAHKEGGVVLASHGDGLIADGGDECRHVLCVGATGTGKSRLVVLPSLLYSLSAENRRSLIVFDVKGELRQATEPLARSRGYSVLDINFRRPEAGDGWNPFARANRLRARSDRASREKAWKLVENIIDAVFSDGSYVRADPFWRTQSASLFRGICAILWQLEKPISLQAVLRLSDTIPADRDQDPACALFSLVDGLPESCQARRLLAGIRTAGSQTRGNILTCYRGYLAPMVARDDVLRMVSDRQSVDFRRIALEPTILYISLPDDSTALGALQGILLTQLIQELNDCAMANNGRLPVRTDIYLDELCNIHPAIPSLETMLTISRSRGMRYLLTIQSYSQLCGVYGPAADTIAANCSTWIALNIAKDEVFRAKLSALCGSNSLGQPLITPSQLSLLSYEQAIVIRERCAPYFSRLEDVDKLLPRLMAQPAAQNR